MTRDRPPRPERDPVLTEALQRRMAVTRIAEALGITTGAVSQWHRVPMQHLAVVARITGISKRKLRPDLFPESTTARITEKAAAE